jgi:hypothetical protein
MASSFRSERCSNKHTAAGQVQRGRAPHERVDGASAVESHSEVVSRHDAAQCVQSPPRYSGIYQPNLTRG